MPGPPPWANCATDLAPRPCPIVVSANTGRPLDGLGVGGGGAPLESGKAFQGTPPGQERAAENAYSTVLRVITVTESGQNSKLIPRLERGSVPGELVKLHIAERPASTAPPLHQMVSVLIP